MVGVRHNNGKTIGPGLILCIWDDLKNAAVEFLCSFSVLCWLLFLVALLQARPVVLQQLNCIAELPDEGGQVHPG